MELSIRLKTVAEAVTPGNRVADIGTDHGYVPIYLVKNNLSPGGIAMDVNKGPLEKAKEHIRAEKLSGKIATRLGNGLAPLEPGETDTVVIAGMGGDLICKILKAKPEFLIEGKELILQPQSEVMEFRKFLWESGYTIVAEDMVLEDGKYYPMMRVVYENAQKEIPDVLALKYGEKLLEQKHPVLKQYLLWQKMQKEKILGNLQKNAKKDVSSRKEEIEEELSYIAHALEKIDGAK